VRRRRGSRRSSRPRSTSPRLRARTKARPGLRLVFEDTLQPFVEISCCVSAWLHADVSAMTAASRTFCAACCSDWSWLRRCCCSRSSALRAALLAPIEALRTVGQVESPGRLDALTACRPRCDSRRQRLSRCSLAQRRTRAGRTLLLSPPVMALYAHASNRLRASASRAWGGGTVVSLTSA
jgi:hypothetical protein